MASAAAGRTKRKLRIRKKISGTSARPRLSVFRTSRHIYAQVVDDNAGHTLASASTLSKDFVPGDEKLSKTEAAKKVGILVGQICKEKQITTVVFDRNGYIYHGRVVALAEGAREAGLDFLGDVLVCNKMLRRD
jgi:large subunit ribosomal protein L18